MDENLYLPKGNYLYTYVCTQTYMYVCIYAHIICLYIYTLYICIYEIDDLEASWELFFFFFFSNFWKITLILDVLKHMFD